MERTQEAINLIKEKLDQARRCLRLDQFNVKKIIATAASRLSKAIDQFIVSK